MARYDFDRVIDRHGTNSLKYDFAAERGHPVDSLPLWVADMDFAAPPCVNEAVHRLADQGIFGYSEVKDAYFNAAAGWFEGHFGWRPEPAWLVKTPGVVFALAMAVRALTQPGDGVIIQTPVYYPFYEVIRENGRRVVENPLLLRNGHYEIDFDGFEALIRQEKIKLFLLCSPHNPTGRVWTKEELKRLGNICERYSVYVVSDEIHCDFAFPGHPHTVFLQAAPELAERTIICNSGSKTFNIAGLQASNIWIPGADTREKFRREIAGTGYSQLNAAGLIAMQAAYEGGGEWHDQCVEYLLGNLAFFRDFLRERLPGLKLIEPEGTYLAWVDFSALGLSDEALDDLIARRARLWLDAGSIFGSACGQYQRFVLACPRSVLSEALERLEGAIRSLP